MYIYHVCAWRLWRQKRGLEHIQIVLSPHVCSWELNLGPQQE